MALGESARRTEVVRVTSDKCTIWKLASASSTGTGPQELGWVSLHFLDHGLPLEGLNPDRDSHYQHFWIDNQSPVWRASPCTGALGL